MSAACLLPECVADFYNDTFCRGWPERQDQRTIVGPSMKAGNVPVYRDQRLRLCCASQPAREQGKVCQGPAWRSRRASAARAAPCGPQCRPLQVRTPQMCPHSLQTAVECPHLCRICNTHHCLLNVSAASFSCYKPTCRLRCFEVL